MDALSAVLRQLNFRAAGFRRLTLGAPWALAFDQAGRIAFGGSGEATTILCGAFAFDKTEHPALAGLPRFVHVAGSGGKPALRLGGYVETLLSEAEDEGPGSAVVLARLSAALVVRALRHGLGDHAVAKAPAALHDGSAQPWTLAALARQSGLSRAAFAGRFRAGVGETPMRYLHLRRMRQAAEHLREGRLALAKVAEAAGYRSETAFLAAFRRHSGLPPGEFRRRNASAERNPAADAAGPVPSRPAGR
jgi:AraC-like DNA-binding protein